MNRLLITMMVALPCLAQEVELLPLLQQGEAIELLSIRTRGGVTRMPITVKVLEKTEKGLVLDWVPGESDLSEFPEAKSDPVAAAALNAASGLHIEAELSARGEFTRVRNAELALAELQKRVDAIVKLVPPEAQGEVRQFLPPAALLSAAAQDIQVYFRIHGAIVRRGEPVEREIEERRIDGKVVPGYFQLKLESADSGSATLSTVTRYDAQSRETVTYMFDRIYGVMSSVKGESTVGGKVAESFELQLVKKP